MKQPEQNLPNSSLSEVAEVAAEPAITASSQAALQNNPLLERGPLPPFDRIEAQHVEPAVRAILKRCQKQLAQIEHQIEESSPSWELLEQLNQLEYELQRSWGPVEHLLAVKNSPELRRAHESVQEDVVRFSLRLSQSRAIFKALEKLATTSLSPPQKRILELRLKEARRAGVALEGAALQRFSDIVAQLSRLSTDFANHLLDSTNAFALLLTERSQVEGLPLSLLRLAAQSYNTALDQNQPESDTPGNSSAGDGAAESDAVGNSSAGNGATGDVTPPATAEKGPWRITLDLPSYLPFMQHAADRSLREKLYRVYISRASYGKEDNLPLIERILELRQEQAQLLGYENYAQLTVENRMAERVEDIYGLLEELQKVVYPLAGRELQELQELADASGENEPIAHWDIPFWAERLRERSFGFTDEELRPYFPLPRVLHGLFTLSEQIFGIKIEAADKKAPLWHPDVRYFIVNNEKGEEIASFYLDPYSRPQEKRGGAWMGDCIGRRRTASGIEKPVAYLICNSMPPTGDRPSLMSFHEVTILFHEFGHGLQHLLTEVDFPDVAGINGIEWDAVEIASQFMENWCYQRKVLLDLSAHLESGESLPDVLCEKIAKSRTYRAASTMLRQISFSLVDMELHYRYNPTDKKRSALQLEQAIRRKLSPLPPLPEDRFLCSFSHIFAGSYAAGYYSYKWAEVFSADAFSAFEEAGLEEQQSLSQVGRRFRDTILALGGSRHPAEVFQLFRGRKATTDALLRHAGLKLSA